MNPFTRRWGASKALWILQVIVTRELGSFMTTRDHHFPDVFSSVLTCNVAGHRYDMLTSRRSAIEQVCYVLLLLANRNRLRPDVPFTLSGGPTAPALSKSL